MVASGRAMHDVRCGAFPWRRDHPTGYGDARLGCVCERRYTDAIAISLADKSMIRSLLLASCLAFAATAAAQDTPAAAQDTPETVQEAATPAPAAAAPAATATTAATHGDAARGRQLVYTCQGCHGVTGYENAYPNYHVPKIGGQSEVYLANALTEYQQGKRKHPTMQAQAESFSAQDIADIAAFLSSLK